MIKPQSQRGEGTTNYMLLFVFIIFVGKFAFATIPAYLENRKLDGLITERLNTKKTENGDSLIRYLEGQIEMDFSGHDVADVITVVDGTPGSIVLRKQNHVAKTFFGNIDIVSRYDKEYRQ